MTALCRHELSPAEADAAGFTVPMPPRTDPCRCCGDKTQHRHYEHDIPIYCRMHCSGLWCFNCGHCRNHCDCVASQKSKGSSEQKMLLNMARSTDAGERQTAKFVAYGRLLHAALTCAASDIDEKADRDPGSFSGIYDDVLLEQAADYVAVMSVLND